ncbi:MAG: methylated-DNA--[protein]-cysteine S-methyltransferase [Verrucomicrobiota bacterium]|nr:methylated-DNA--[protein]-cysteine S-methyltransferase [Verrucomicrobiota bacterium]
MNDYERIAQVIRYLDRDHIDQPDLETLAAQVKLSPSHFHRLFSKWAGITPKDFLQCLTLAHAKECLRAGQNALETAFETGLSGPGRLHDLCVTLESASPGEIKSGGLGWTIKAGFAESPFGSFLIAEGPRGICHLMFLEVGTENDAWSHLQASWPKASLTRNDTLASQWARKIFTSVPNQLGLRAYVRGTPFQIKVWQALLKVRKGELVSYGALAQSIKNPAACRAVGTAVGQNPIAYLIPCHRVIRETGVLGNYRWDPIRKRAMIAWESNGI